MSDPAVTIRKRFPRWRTDPYQKEAVDSLLRVVFAAEAVDRQLGVVAESVAYFLSDPPASLSFGAPARQVKNAAKRLRSLADQLERAVKKLDDLGAYVSQFETREPREARA